MAEGTKGFSISEKAAEFPNSPIHVHRHLSEATLVPDDETSQRPASDTSLLVNVPSEKVSSYESEDSERDITDSHRGRSADSDSLDRSVLAGNKEYSWLGKGLDIL